MLGIDNSFLLSDEPKRVHIGRNIVSYASICWQGTDELSTRDLVRRTNPKILQGGVPSSEIRFLRCLELSQTRLHA